MATPHIKVSRRVLCKIHDEEEEKLSIALGCHGWRVLFASLILLSFSGSVAG